MHVFQVQMQCFGLLLNCCGVGGKGGKGGRGGRGHHPSLHPTPNGRANQYMRRWGMQGAGMVLRRRHPPPPSDRNAIPYPCRGFPRRSTNHSRGHHVRRVMVIVRTVGCLILESPGPLTNTQCSIQQQLVVRCHELICRNVYVV
jgi:hypothetical protein